MGTVEVVERSPRDSDSRSSSKSESEATGVKIIEVAWDESGSGSVSDSNCFIAEFEALALRIRKF